jgi:hypothetical protein
MKREKREEGRGKREEHKEEGEGVVVCDLCVRFLGLMGTIFQVNYSDGLVSR